ncbi:hypothetical protein BJV82DRAFT_152353 [Fennellomyces sp. T-0311]|nr:hypothetical protein BJV82DRAFT_152353 [Fennellomyces sp. T-0311]
MKVAGSTEHGRYNDLPATNVVDQTSKATAPAIDAETLLAQLSSLSNGNLGNLTTNIAPSQPMQQPQDRHGDTAALPPALARLFGINDATPAPPVPQQQTPSPTAPSFPMPLPQQTSKTSADPRLRQRSPPPRRMDPRIQQASANNTPLGTRHSQQQQQQQQPTRTRPSRWNQDSAPAPQHHHNDNRRDGWHEPPPPPRMDHRPPRSHMPPPRTSSLPGPISDTSLPNGAIKVLTRTLFVGPLPGWFGKEDVANIFEQYGELHSIIMSKKIKTRVNAFLKYTTRASLEAAMQDTANLMVDDVKVKVNFGFGFGPRKLFNYDSGESIIPLNELTEDEKSSLVTAPVGGFQGLSVRDQMIIEEPEVQYRPEWKMDENSSTRTNKTRGPSNNDHHNHHSGRHKRRRFDSNDDQPNWTGGGGYSQQQQHQHPISNVPPNFFFDMQQQLQQQEQQMQQEQKQYQDNGQAYYQHHYDYS